MSMVIVLAYFFEVFIIELYARSLYASKVKFGIRLIAYIVIYGGMILFHSPGNVLRNTLLDIVANVLILSVLFDNYIISAIYNSVILVSVNFITELFVGNIISHFNNNFWKDWETISNYIFLVISRSVFIGIVIIIIHIQKKSMVKAKKPELEGYISTGIAVCIIGFLTVISNLISSVPYSKTNELLFFLAILIIGIVLVLTMILFKHIEKRNIEYTNVLLQLQKSEANQMYIESINQKDEGLRILVHDIKNHLQSMAVLNEQGENEKLSKYIDDLVRRANLKAANDISTNKLLNAIVYRYYNQAISKKIKFSYDVRDVNIENIEEIDITSILCNLLDNAMEGCSGSNPFIDLIIHSGQSAESIVISVVNSCLKNPIVDKKGKLITSKNNKTIHGYGLESVRKTAEKYGGEVNVYYLNEDETFHATVILYEGKNENTNMR